MIIPAALVGGDGTYTIQNSGEFDGSTSYLERTFGTATEAKTFTLALWVKRTTTGTNDMIMDAFTAASDAGRGIIMIDSSDKLLMSGNSTVWKQSTATFTGTSTWWHFTFIHDGGNATAADRDRMYANGTRITAFDISNNAALDDVFGQLNGATRHAIGIQEVALTGDAFVGRMADVYFIDGQAIEPEDNFISAGVPIAYEGTYGNNGFFLEFQNSGSLGTDTSGNGNNWTNSGVTQSTDTPTS
jgi:hypothetical protein